MATLCVHDEDDDDDGGGDCIRIVQDTFIREYDGLHRSMNVHVRVFHSPWSMDMCGVWVWAARVLASW